MDGCGKVLNEKCWRYLPRGLVLVRTDKKLDYHSVMAEDFITATDCNKRGCLAIVPNGFTVGFTEVGGDNTVSDIYKSGRYQVCFFEVIAHPDMVKITYNKKGKMLPKKKWAFPKILNERWKK